MKIVHELASDNMETKAAITYRRSVNDSVYSHEIQWHCYELPSLFLNVAQVL